MISVLHHYALEVPDLEVADSFLADFGLETAEKDGALIAQCPGRDQEQVRMMPGPVKRLHHVSFTLAPGTLDETLASLERAGSPLIEPPAGADGSGTWLRDPDGTAVQLLEAEQAAARPVAEILTNSGASSGASSGGVSASTGTTNSMSGASSSGSADQQQPSAKTAASSTA